MKSIRHSHRRKGCREMDKSVKPWLETERVFSAAAKLRSLSANGVASMDDSDPGTLTPNFAGVREELGRSIQGKFNRATDNLAPRSRS